MYKKSARKKAISFFSIAVLLVSSLVAMIPMSDAKADILGDHDVNVYKIKQLENGTTTWENAPLVGKANQYLPAKDEPYYIQAVSYGYGGAGVHEETNIEGLCIDDINPDREVINGTKSIDVGYSHLVKYYFQPIANCGLSRPEQGVENGCKITFNVPKGYDASTAKIVHFNDDNGRIALYSVDDTISVNFMTYGDPNNENGYCSPISFYVEYKAGETPKKTIVASKGDARSSITAIRENVDDNDVLSSSSINQGSIYDGWKKSVEDYNKSNKSGGYENQKLNPNKLWIYSFSLANNGVVKDSLNGKTIIGVPKPAGLSKEDKESLRLYPIKYSNYNEYLEYVNQFSVRSSYYSYMWPTEYYEDSNMIYFSVGNYSNSESALPKTIILAVTSNIAMGQGTWSNMDDESVAPPPTNNKSQTENSSKPAKVGTVQAVNSDGQSFTKDSNGDVRCYNKDGSQVKNDFKCDGVSTYFFQADGTAMKDRLTYHPDGVHVIYFDDQGHEVFSNFAHVKKAIAGNDVDDFCFFDVYGHLYVDVLTYDQAGQRIYYANPYGVMEVNKWFQFSNNVKWADGTPADANKNQYGFANYDGTLATNGWTYDFLGRWCYLQGNGVALY